MLYLKIYMFGTLGTMALLYGSLLLIVGDWDTGLWLTLLGIVGLERVYNALREEEA